MNHLGTKTLETDRLILRRFALFDAEAMFRNWASDQEVTKYLTWQPYQSIESARTYIETLIENYENPTAYDWAIELKSLGQVIGSMGVVRCNDEVGCVHIGYCIGQKWWHQGITSEAFAAVIKYLMDEVKVNRIDSRHDPKNINSGKVMKKCGLQYEGTLRSADKNNQGICDAAWYGLLRNDYYK